MPETLDNKQEEQTELVETEAQTVSSQSTDTESAQAGSETTSDASVQQPPATPGWDKERQFRDEIRASQKREQQMKSQLDELNTRLAQMEQAQQTPEEADPDLDDYDQLKDQVIQLKNELKETAAARVQDQKLLQEFQTFRNEQEGAKALDALCKDFDQQYGAQHRNAVLDEVNTEYETLQIANLPDRQRHAWIKKALETAYLKQNLKMKSTSDASQQEKPAAPTVDTGQGGTPQPNPVIKGSFKETLGLLKKKWAAEGG
jgi:hypothetical protein